VSLTDLENHWSVDDLEDALAVVEALDEAESRAAAYNRARRK
jgi:hypothetical protein